MMHCSEPIPTIKGHRTVCHVLLQLNKDKPSFSTIPLYLLLLLDSPLQHLTPTKTYLFVRNKLGYKHHESRDFVYYCISRTQAVLGIESVFNKYLLSEGMNKGMKERINRDLH